MIQNIVLVLGAIFLLFGCNNEPKPLMHTSETVDADFAAQIEVNYHLFSNGDASEAINDAVAKKIKTQLNQPNAVDLASAIKAFDDEYKAFKKDFEDSAQPWTLSIETEILYQSENHLTIALTTYQDTGGAHGNDRIDLLNFDPETGELLTYKDVFTDMESLKRIVEQEFHKNIASESNLDEQPDYFFGKEFQLPENFGFMEEGIIFLYNIYEVVSYDGGYMEFVVDVERLEPYLKTH